jgi:hypothetical protein
VAVGLFTVGRRLLGLLLVLTVRGLLVDALLEVLRRACYLRGLVVLRWRSVTPLTSQSLLLPVAASLATSSSGKFLNTLMCTDASSSAATRTTVTNSDSIAEHRIQPAMVV